ncbi:MAG: hypothetical protein A2521_03370 [Deltaproteobacteria bacterium RIFOXYD12_FULL_57_12]|nr:MAG: hypothetical protein A2521_03370 [Deltaproteobacteria bacterium RIFOXYD12_FULL_57_12]
MKILIAEDDPAPRQFLETALSQMGYEVWTAEDGLTAREIVEKEKISFVIADWLMPGMDGPHLCRALRRQEGDGYVYFILVTARDGTEDVIEGFNAGADDYLTKPFVLEELESRVRAGERVLKLEATLRAANENLITLNKRLEELVRIDPLLGIGNRRSFHEVIEKSHDRSCRYRHSYGVIMCDIDFFKAYNDTYGHIRGDHILQKVAGAIKESARTSDEVFRYGGEEIVVILPDQHLETTMTAANRIHRAIAALDIEHKNSPFGRVTISCGVAVFDRDCNDQKWSTVVERADQALYRAKKAGRNRADF